MTDQPQVGDLLRWTPPGGVERCYVVTAITRAPGCLIAILDLAEPAP